MRKNEKETKDNFLFSAIQSADSTHEELVQMNIREHERAEVYANMNLAFKAGEL